MHFSIFPKFRESYFSGQGIDLQTMEKDGLQVTLTEIQVDKGIVKVCLGDASVYGFYRVNPLLVQCSRRFGVYFSFYVNFSEAPL